MNDFVSRGKVMFGGQQSVGRVIFPNEFNKEERVLVTFVQNAVCLMETTSKHVRSIQHSDGSKEIISESPSHTDFYGFFTSFHSLLTDSPEKQCSDVVVGEIIVNVTRCYVIPADFSTSDPFAGTRYYNVPRDWFLIEGDDERNGRQAVQRFVDNPRENPSPVMLCDEFEDYDHVIWKSNQTAEQNKASFIDLLEWFRGQWAMDHNTITRIVSEYDTHMGDAG